MYTERITSKRHTVYKGSVNVNQTTATASHDVHLLNQIKFNAIRLDCLNMFSSAGLISPLGPFFVVADSLKPLCFDLVGGKLISVVGGTQNNLGGNLLVTDHLTPIKMTSDALDKLRTPLQISIVDSSGNLINLTGVPNPFIAVSISFWEVHEIYSSSD